MRKALFCLAGFAACGATPALAASGYAGAAYVRSDVDFGPFEEDGDGFEIAGAVAFGGPGGLGVEVDAAYSDIEDADAIGVVGHLYANAQAYRLGGFIGLADAEDDTVLSVGGEGLYYLRDITLAGAVGYATADDADLDAIGVDGEVRYFFADNLRVDGRLGWASVDAAGGDDDAFSFGVGGEWLATGLPVSVFGGYQRTSFDEADAEIDTLRVGLRWNWGADLRDRDRAGASLAGLSSVARIAGGG